MRFIVFYSDHPKSKGYISRVWHTFQSHPNFKGEMTHNLFIKHYHIDPKSISSLGDVYYNIKNKQWELEPNKPLVAIKEERMHQDRFLILNFMNEKYKTDIEMINYSLQEQQMVARAQFLKNASVNLNIRTN